MENTTKLAKGGLRNGSALLQETTNAADELQADAYRLAFADTEFLLRRETRGIRIQLEMLKPDLDQTTQGVNDTVVVFGSARFKAPEDADAMLLAAVNDEKLQKARAQGDSKALADEEAVVSAGVEVLRELARVCAELDLRKPCIVQSREKPKLKGDWMDVQCGRFGEQYPQGVYVVDFGGGGPDLNFFKKGEGLSSIGKDRSLRLGQPVFVGEMLRREYASSEAFQGTVSFLRDKISAHAAAHGVSRVVCKVYQTGMARQQHYLGNIEPSPAMTYFQPTESELLRAALAEKERSLAEAAKEIERLTADLTRLKSHSLLLTFRSIIRIKGWMLRTLKRIRARKR